MPSITELMTALAAEQAKLQALADQSEARESARVAAVARAEELQREATALVASVHELEEMVGEGEILLQERAATIVKLRARVAELEGQQPTPTPTPTPVPGELPVGIIDPWQNLAAENDYDDEGQWANVRHGFRRFDNVGGGAFTGPLSPDLYPLAGTAVTVNHLRGYPRDADYLVFYAGNGTLKFENIGKWSAAPVRDGDGFWWGKLRVRAGADAEYLKLTIVTDANDPIRDLVIQSPDADVSKSPFRPVFVSLLKSCANGARLMDWTQINHSPLVEWADRPTPAQFYQTSYRAKETEPAPKGVALEYCIDLLNAADMPGEFHVPHLASDDFTAKMAALILARLKPNLWIRLTLSNEAWNDKFKQYHHFQALAQQRGIAHPRAFAQELKRHVQTFRQVWGAMGAADRVHPVLEASAKVPWWGREALAELAKGGKAKDWVDTLAVTMYRDLTRATMTEDQYVEAMILRADEKWPIIAEAKKDADAHGLAFGIYEWGAHPRNESEGLPMTRHPRAGEYLRRASLTAERDYGRGCWAAHYVFINRVWGVLDSMTNAVTSEKFKMAQRIKSAAN